MPLVSELTVFCGAMVALPSASSGTTPTRRGLHGRRRLTRPGGAIAPSVIIKQELLLPFIGGVFILEAASVILQVGSYKLRSGKRIFRMAPLHHHFELLGWSESKSSSASDHGAGLRPLRIDHAKAQVSRRQYLAPITPMNRSKTKG